MRIFKGKTPYALMLTVIALALMWQLHRLESAFLSNVRNLVFDSYQTIRPRTNTDSAVLIVDIDEASLHKIGQWPWPRNLIGELVLKLRDAGAAAIGLDMVFAEADRTDPKTIIANLDPELRAEITRLLADVPDNDAVLADAISQAPVALGFIDAAGNKGHSAKKIAGIAWLGADLAANLQQINGSIASLPQLQEAARGSAIFIVSNERSDDIIRSVPLFVSDQGDVYPTLSIETLRIAVETASGEPQSFVIKTSLASGENSSGLRAITEAKVADFVIPTTANGELQIYYAKQDSNQFLSAAKVLSQPAENLAQLMEGKIVMVGASATGLHDVRTTSLREQIPGVAIHAQMIDQIMQGAFISRPDWAPGLERLMMIVAALLIALILPVIGPILSAIFGAVIAVIIIAASWTAFAGYGLLLDPVFPMLSSLLIYALMTILLFAFSEREKKFVRSAFQHYLAPDLLKKLEQSPASLKLGGEIRDLSLMFMDIRNFTAISERLDPQELVHFLNTLLTPLSEIIQKNEGAIDKYIGDSIMAFWNAPLDVEDHPQKACRAALQMLGKMHEMNRLDVFGFKQRGLGDVNIGIGINSGDGCVGNMGSDKRFNYTVVGDTVNVAARIETACKKMQWPVLVSKPTAIAAPQLAFLEAGKITLEGKSRRQSIFALVGDEALAYSPDFRLLKEAHKKLMTAIVAGNRANITKSRKACIRLAPPEMHGFFTEWTAQR